MRGLFCLLGFLFAETAWADAGKAFLKAAQFEKVHREIMAQEAENVIGENAFLRPLLPDLVDQMLKILPPSKMEAPLSTALNREFTAAELKEMSLFFGTPTGQKALRRLPPLFEQAYAREEDNLKRTLPGFLRDLGRRKKGAANADSR